MLRNLIIRILFRLLDRTLKIDYKKIDQKAYESWLFDSFDNKGWRSYFAYTDLKILKELSFGQPTEKYNMLIGRRLELLYLFDAMRRSFENRKSEKEKKKDVT